MYNKFYSSLHDNLHHKDIDKLADWANHMYKFYDFWAIAYYPFGMVEADNGAFVEDVLLEKDINEDWEIIREFALEMEKQGKPFFMGYEWQGSGKDGDHNVFFLNNDNNMNHTHEYSQLVKDFEKVEAIGIPHHVSYKLGSRGKNWDTHNEKFSPFAEIYSSHGCSENDNNRFGMKTHVHMGPGYQPTSYEAGLNKKIKVGCIASGDNHHCPGIYDNGTICVLAKNNTKEELWDALRKSRVYGVSLGRINVDFTLDDAFIGETIYESEKSEYTISIEGDNAIDRVEVLKDNVLEEMIVHSGTWERSELKDTFDFKVKFEFGWGPDRRVFPEIDQKRWEVLIKGDCDIKHIQPCFNHMDQDIKIIDSKKAELNIVSHKSTTAGKWMGPAPVSTESIVVTFTGSTNSIVELIIDGKEYQYSVNQLLQTSDLIVMKQESHKLIKEAYGMDDFYRDDMFHHNAYKVKVHQAIPEAGYTLKHTGILNTIGSSNIRVRVHQKNGAVAWLSPVFIKRR